MMNTGDLSSQNKSTAGFSEMLDLKASELIFYSPFSFLHSVGDDILTRETFINPLKKEISEEACNVRELDVEGYKHYFVWRDLPWDSKYFKRRMIRLDLILFDHRRADIAGRAVTSFINDTIHNNDYIFINIPCEDLLLLQGLSVTGFRLVETRLNYYFSGYDTAEPSLLPVRRAGVEDISALKDVAMRMRNRYDRVHADPAFTTEEGDAYLGTFIEESVKGFADMVLVPDVTGEKPFGFLAANNPRLVLGHNIAKLVLAAVDNSVHKGWLYHLLTGVIFELKGQKTDILTTITQASNLPAIHTWEKAGFKLGFVTHVYSFSRR
jgi:dTDP-4-amino-4,6-dideoxy-D-galactose acyltransferase